MRYLLAIVLPPVAVLLCGKPFQFLLNLLFELSIVGMPIAMVHALLVVKERMADERQKRMLRSMHEMSVAAAAAGSMAANMGPRAPARS